MKQHVARILGFKINLLSYFSSKLACRFAIYLFSKPLKGRLKDDEREYLDFAYKEEVTRQGISIMTYRWLGKKETVLLVHGWESNAYRWKTLIELLKKENYQIVAIDAPAHGNSGGRTFNAIIYSELVYEVAHKFNVNIIVGHSVGGMSTIFSQYNRELDTLQKLVLLGAPSNVADILDRYAKMMGYNDRVIDAINQYTKKHYNHLPSYYNASSFCKTIKAQGLVIHDKEDNIIPFNDALDYEKNYSNAKLIQTNGLGHKLRSEDVNKYIIDFINA